MSKVKYTNAFGSDNFTENKIYTTFVTEEGLAVIDDKQQQHIIADTVNDDETYEGDRFFRNNFEWVNASDEVKTGDEQSDDPDWSINCPHCGHKHKDWQNFIDVEDMNGEFVMTCENDKCEGGFHVTYKTEITFTTKKPESGVTPK